MSIDDLCMACEPLGICRVRSEAVFELTTKYVAQVINDIYENQLPCLSEMVRVYGWITRKNYPCEQLLQEIGFIRGTKVQIHKGIDPIILKLFSAITYSRVDKAE